ncbi:hypothetical protein G9A89_001394 [Geosiphon pyriformis]|nr:hypothetical protein G9A89_001394 [Geosiphon pyriformis]
MNLLSLTKNSYLALTAITALMVAFSSSIPIFLMINMNILRSLFEIRSVYDLNESFRCCDFGSSY